MLSQYDNKKFFSVIRTQRGFFGIRVGGGVFIDKKWLICYNKNANGNPTNYLGISATWEKGRQLKQYGSNTYKYNNEGIRIQKTTSTEMHEYIFDGTNIVKKIVTDIYNCPKYTNEYLYDLDGTKTLPFIVSGVATTYL